MKIITNDAAYVQKHDIAFLTNTDLEIPASIFMKVFGNGIVVINNSNRWDFVKFEDENDIKYFKGLDWIVDYNDVKDLSEDAFIVTGSAIAEKKNEIAKIYNKMTENERKENMHIVYRCERLDHKMYSLRDILWFKQGHLEMDLPLIPDDKGFSFTGDDECEYQIRSSIDPNKLLFYRKDGKSLSDSDRIPYGFIESAMSVAIMKREDKDSFFGDYEIRKYLSEDCKYFVIQFKVKEYDDKLETENIEQETISKQLVKKIKTIFKNKIR